MKSWTGEQVVVLNAEQDIIDTQWDFGISFFMVVTGECIRESVGFIDGNC